MPEDAPETDAFPLVVQPVSVPWWEPGFGGGDDGFSRALDAREQAEEATLDAALPPYEACAARARRSGARFASRRALASRFDGLGERPHVLFVGMAFFWRRELTVDLDEGRLTVS